MKWFWSKEKKEDGWVTAKRAPTPAENMLCYMQRQHEDDIKIITELQEELIPLRRVSVRSNSKKLQELELLLEITNSEVKRIMEIQD